jgi:hypothetical protein
MNPVARHSAQRCAVVRAILAAVCINLALGAAAPVSGQGLDLPTPGDTIYELRHPTGGRSLGWIKDRSADTVTFRSFEGGEWTLDRHSAPLRRARGTIVGGEFWREDQNQSRLFFAPTGRTLHAGQAYVGVFTVLPFAGFGVSDDFTIAGGFNPFYGELANMDLWLAPKVRVMASPERQVSVGGFFLQLAEGNPFDWDDYSYNPETYRLAIAYGVGTWGTHDRAWHAGGGIAHQFTGGSRTRVMGMVGGETRIARRWKIITENWLLVPDYPMISVGARSIGDRWTYDIGFMALLAEEGAPYMPIFSFSYAFGAGR